MRRVNKPWGHEEIWAECAAYVGKLLVIRAGHRLSLQHHEIKEETIRLNSGRMELELENDAGELELHVVLPGEAYHIYPGKKHRMKAVEDCEVLEVSTPHLKDVVRHSDYYGREGTSES
jgi:quercetin dioxygenase-like cupin family protein